MSGTLSSNQKEEMGTRSLKFGTVAVAADLSYTSSEALRYAEAIARLHESVLVLVHVIDPSGYAFPDGMPSYIHADEPARNELKKIEEDTRSRGIPVHFVMERGIVCERILQAVNDHHADLLILGTRAKTEVGRAALGTVARQVLVDAPCPILTVSPDADESLPWAGSWRRVLAATDFSAASIAGVRCAYHLAFRQLIALHVVERQNEPEHKHLRERLQLITPFHELPSVPVEYIVKTGETGEVISKYAHNFGTDLVVLGTPADEPQGKDWHASTVLQVISEVRCPVLCVPSSHDASAEELVRRIASM